MILTWWQNISFFAVLLVILSKIALRWIFWDLSAMCSNPRSSYSQEFHKTSVFHLCWSIFCNKVVGKGCNLIDKESPIQVLLDTQNFWKHLFYRIAQDEWFWKYLRHLWKIDSKHLHLFPKVFPNYKMYKITKTTLKSAKNSSLLVYWSRSKVG